MKVFKSVFEFYLNSSIHVALAVYSLVRITELYFDFSYNEPLNYFIFYGTITGYNFVKYAGIAGLHHLSLTKNLRLIQLFSLCAFLLMIYYGAQLSLETLSLFIPFGLLTLFYAVPLFDRFSINLRSIASLKIIIIALVWAGVTFLVPVLNKGEINYTCALGFIQRFFFVIVLTLPFDIRDLRFDKKRLQTIPQLIGVERTKKMGFVLLAFTMVIEFLITPNRSFKFVYLMIFMCVLFLLQRAGRKQPKYYASFLVEAVPIFWWISLEIMK
ncbi:hypothetical protein ACOSP6_10725 [Tenacibaculum sp. MEBiC06402]|uniref:hypothetical protein n=1 Tax=unclassified Tenacibaculum TaxID=2635139 RepID=UPI003B98F78E